MVEPVKRKYRSPRRAAAAAATREQIRRAATELFVERGYVATTMRDVARRAGVGERTLYDAFPSKSTLFGHALAVATVGDEQPVRVADRPEVHAAWEEADPVEGARQVVAYAVELLERAGDLIMVSVEAAGTDPDMRAAADAGAAATRQVHLEFTTRLEARGVLRDGTDAEAAADALFALLSPHVHQLLRRYRRWSASQYRAWLEEACLRELLG